MANGNGNGAWVKWALGIIVLALSTTVSYVVANDSFSRSRDTVESEKRELLKNEIIRIDTNQVTVIKKVDKILDNQDSMVKTLTRLETKIEKL